MCCHYNNHSGNICQMVRDCDIHQADGDETDYPCMMVEQQPIDKIVTAAIGLAHQSCREISQHLVRPVFFDIATDGSKYGIFGCFPWELLHLYSLGILKYLLLAVYNYQQVPHLSCTAEGPDVICSGCFLPKCFDKSTYNIPRQVLQGNFHCYVMPE